MNRSHRIPLAAPALLGLLAAALIAGLLGADPSPLAAKEPPLLTWDHYYDQDQVTAALKRLAAAYPELTELQSIGRSAEGRDIWQLTITSEKTGPALSKPAMYVDGAIHGNEIQATEVCLYLAWQLLTKYGEWDRITELLDRSTFYIVPTVNVDGRARYFEDAGSYRIGRTARVPYDDDRDGLFDEDDYDDLDGDGQILQMRIRDPWGQYRTNPDEPRSIIRVKPGEQGEWTLLGLEGIDNDGDGRVNEDTPGYLDMNRNYGFKWQPSYVQSGAGDFPFSAANTKTIADFVNSHPNICFQFTFHNYGGMFLRGPGSKLSPPYSPADLKVYDYLGAEGEKTVPGYRYLISSEDLYTTYGDMDEWMYQCFGVMGFTGELFMSSQTNYRSPGEPVPTEDEERGPSGSSLKERQQFNDHLMMGEMFEPWKPFEHPTYGPIEIGGWRAFTTRMPPAFMLQDLVHRNAMFVTWTATQLPQMSLEVTEVKDLGGGLWRVRARAANATAMPSLSAQARNRKLCRLDEFRIGGKGIEVLAGGILEDPYFDLWTPVEHRPARISTFVPGFGKQEVQWIVSGRGPVTVTYDGLKCGQREATAALQ
jgi:hypothetical protein